mgnify:CR=1 FL=1
MANAKTSNPLDEKEPILTKEELNARRQEISAFYKDNIPHLEVQAEYEMLLATIEKSRAERLQAQMYMAQAYASQKEGAFVIVEESADGKYKIVDELGIKPSFNLRDTHEKILFVESQNDAFFYNEISNKKIPISNVNYFL